MWIEAAQRLPLHALIGHLLIYPGGLPYERANGYTPGVSRSTLSCWMTLASHLMAPSSRPPMGLDANCGPLPQVYWSCVDPRRTSPSTTIERQCEWVPLAYNNLAHACPCALTNDTKRLLRVVEGGQKFDKALEPKWPHDNTHVEVVQPSCSSALANARPATHIACLVLTNHTTMFCSGLRT